MATVSIDKEIIEEYSWGSYPYETWNGDSVKTWGEAGRVRFSADATEDQVSFVEAVSRNMLASVKELLSAKEAFSRSNVFNRGFKEAIDIDETYWDNVRFFLQFSENIKPRDAFGKSYGVTRKESLPIEEETHKLIDKRIFEIGKEASWRSYIHETWNGDANATWKDNESWLQLADEFIQEVDYSRGFYENLAADDKYAMEYGKSVTEDVLNASDAVINEYLLSEAEKTAFADEMRQRNIYRRNIEDNISIADTLAKHPQSNIKEAFILTDKMLRAANSVLSDIYISERLFNEEDFIKSANSMAGYTSFFDFKVGEYEYKDAMVRVVLRSDSQAEPTAQGITMHVDIPDTDDRGFVSIIRTDEATYIQFNKHYYTIPEVQVTLRGGSSSAGNIVPHIVTIDTHGFYVELLGASGRTTGSISWVAKGY